MRLKNKKAIVTGANRSIGRGIAVEFAREGADVVISYRSDGDGAGETVEMIEKLGRKGKALYGDFSTVEGIEQFFKESVDFLGSVDILVNNAAAYNTKGFLELGVDEFEQMLMVNVRAPMVLSQMAAKEMIKNGIEGKIINISAITGTRPHPNRLAHATAKGALNMLTKSMALDLAPHKIRVNAIAPGSTPYETDEDVEFGENSPLQRQGTPEDQAKGAVYLASDDAPWVTGLILTIDGGESLG